ncbi:hypothetical protein D9613_006854 [Agrocybe pediades]|uniref:non-specific serine/threonine protein kinase n=1 Tax=Agrocybe pediades TaxID=84607 RepID=A0A8H4QH12_9AGAR|nr:hypothetical protein D9613_006854 [Agrocybe pediades]
MTDMLTAVDMRAAKNKHDPKMIGLWKVGRTLGKGFSGHVRIARHSQTGQYAAIKIILKGSLNSRVSLNRLADEVEHSILAVEREIVVMKLIDHPNIMKLYDVWETSSHLYLILEYVQGGELFDYLCEKGRRPLHEVVDYFQQIICAVAHCHMYNIAHRDLKLENILIDQDKNIKVADFGMATWQDEARGKLLRTSCGSPHYAAPEIISGNPYNGSTSDIWSCGVILYALLAAKLPFDDDDCPTLLHKISLGHYIMPEDIDSRAQNLLRRMLTLDVKKRITMQEIMCHPFFLSQPLKNPKAMPSGPDMDLIARPIGKISAIDPDIFSNLRTLWHGVSDASLMESLLSSERNWQKGIYHLLVDYRRRYLKTRKQEEDQRLQAESRANDKGKQKDKSPHNPHTPIRTRKQQGIIEIEHSAFPQISLSGPSPEGKALPTLSVPDVENEKIRVFFQEVANHLNFLAKSGADLESPALSPSSAGSSKESPPPLLNVPGIPLTPMQFRYNEGVAEHTSTPLQPRNEKQNENRTTRPLSVRRKSRIPRLVTTGGKQDKENENAIPITESDLINGLSPLTQHSAAMADVNHLQINTTPVNRRPSKLKKKAPPVKTPASPMFSEAGSSFSIPSPVNGPLHGSWLDNVFKFKPVTYNLFSRYDLHTTRIECMRLLMEMNLLVSMEESDKVSLLKCRTHDAKDSNNTLLGLKSVKFRIEMRWPTPQLCHEGYLVSLLLVQEKGPLTTFKAIYQQLADSWTLGEISATPLPG